MNLARKPLERFTRDRVEWGYTRKGLKERMI